MISVLGKHLFLWTSWWRRPKSCNPREDEYESQQVNRQHDARNEFLDEQEYLLYFMDFETIQFVVPIYNESRPYQQIPFQYSLLILQSANSSIPTEVPITLRQ